MQAEPVPAVRIYKAQLTAYRREPLPLVFLWLPATVHEGTDRPQGSWAYLFQCPSLAVVEAPENNLSLLGNHSLSWASLLPSLYLSPLHSPDPAFNVYRMKLH